MRLNKTKKILIIVALVVAILTTSISIIVTSLNHNKNNNGGKLPETDLPINYPFEVRANFNRCLLIYVKNYIPTITNVNPLGNALLDAFSKSRISVKKVNDLGNYLKNSKPNTTEYLKKLFKTDENGDFVLDESGNFVFRDDYEDIILKDIFTLPAIFRDVLSSVGFTTKEYASVIYELLLENSSQEYKTALALAPKEKVINVLVNSMQIIETIDNLNFVLDNENVAISLQEALYELGKDIGILRLALGENNLLIVLGLNYKRDVDGATSAKDKEMAIEYNKTIDYLKEIMLYVVDTTSAFLTNLPPKTLAALVPQKAPGGIDIFKTERLKYYAYLNFARTYNNALNSNFNARIKTTLDFKNQLVNVYLQLIKIDALENDKPLNASEIEEIKNTLDLEISEFLITIERVSSNYLYISDYTQMFELDINKFNILKADLDKLEDVDPLISKNTESITSFFILSIYNAAMDAYNNYK